MSGAHRLIATILFFATIPAKDVAARRIPHSVVSAATSHERGVKVGERQQYSHTSSTKPGPQQTSAMLASRSLTLIIQTSVRTARTAPRPTNAVVEPVTVASVSR
jgi:hypothetical protein